MASVVLEHLTRVFTAPGADSVRAVHDVSLVIEDRELVVLVGPSGCGKTTTLRLIAGLEEPTSGVVRLDGRIVNGIPPGDRDIAMVFQHFALYPHLTIAESLAFGLRLRKCARAEVEARVGEAAQALDLTDCLGRRPVELSGGQRQRAALGRAMVRRPGVFLMDEPLSNLDAPMRAQMRTELARLHARMGATLIYVTHDQVEAMMLGQRIVVMNRGEILQAGEPLEVYERPANRFVGGFLGSPPMNFVRGRTGMRPGAVWFEERGGSEGAGGTGFCLRLPERLAGRLNGRTEAEVVLGIRPEHIRCVQNAADYPTDQTVECVVEVVQPLGPQLCLTLGSAEHQLVVCVPASIRPRVGQRLRLAFDLKQAHLFDSGSGRAIT